MPPQIIANDFMFTQDQPEFCIVLDLTLRNLGVFWNHARGAVVFLADSRRAG